MSQSLVDFIYKIVLVGDTNVGKSCLVEKFIFTPLHI
jgi:GTPase SAR1 family protein